jgi:hypothetical protein
MSVVRWGLWTVAAVAGLVLVGCGGDAFQLVEAGGGGGSDGGGTSDAGGGGVDGGGGGNDAGGSPLCPPATNPPMVGLHCPEVSVECEYGPNEVPRCNLLFDCYASGWMQVNSGCPMGTCPRMYRSVLQGQPCQWQGLACGYPEGTCTCSGAFGGPVRIDAGLGPIWRCFAPPMGCPNERPRIGSSCTQSGQACDYAACYGGVALQCNRGIWQRGGGMPCPLTGM